MSYGNDSDYQTVSLQADREKAMTELGIASKLISVIAPDNSTAILKVEQLNRSLLSLSVVEQSVPINQANLYRFIFSLGSGQYSFSAKLSPSTAVGAFTVDISKVELKRLQRRDSFRIEIPTTVNLRFYYNETKIVASSARRVVDLSVGGMALRVRATDPLAKLVKGSTLSGVLHLYGRDLLNIDGRVAHHLANPADQTEKVGIQFINLSHEQQRELLSITLQLHREINHRGG